MAKVSPFATTATIIDLGDKGKALQFNGIPAAVYRTELKAAGSRYNKPLNCWPIGDNEALGKSVVARMAAYAKQAAAKANVTTAAPSKGRGPKTAAHKNFEQLYGKKITKAQFEQLKAILG